MSTPQELWLQAVSDGALLALAGAAVWARGRTYASKGAVQAAEMPALLGDEVMALQATVRGSKSYATRVAIGANHKLRGRCNCPHAADGHFCKHQVALALALRALLGGSVAPAAPATPKKSPAAVKRAQTQAQNREALLAFLHQQDAASLAEKLWAWASQDRYRMNELKAWAAKDRSANDPGALKLAITELLRNSRGFLDWSESGVYAAHAGQVLDWLQPWVQKDAAIALDLCEHALRKLYKVAELADDSNGEVGDLIADLVHVFVAAVEQAQPAAKWLDRWLELMKADPFGHWDEAAVVAVAGPAVQGHYAEKACAEWAAWLQQDKGASKSSEGRGPKSYPSASWHGDGDRERYALRKRYLLAVATRSDDPRTLLEAMTGSAVGAGEWVDVVALCESHGWHREALQFALSAYKRAPDDHRLEAALLRCYERDGWDEEALAIRRKQLNQRPHVEHYRACLLAAERAGCNRAVYREELMQWAQARELQVVSLPPLRVGMPLRRETVRDVTVRVEWWLADGELDAAWALVQPPHHCDSKGMLALARQLPANRDGDAVVVLQRVFEALLPGSKSPYSEVLAVVSEACSRMPLAEAKAWTDGLRSSFKVRRNFVAGLPPL